MADDRLDLRLYRRTGQYETRDNAERTDPVAADAPVATGLESLAGKVVKYLLTPKGSDAFEPDYGGTALHDAQTAESYLPALRLDVQSDISRCADYIRRAEQGLPTGSERLARLILAGVEYDAEARPANVAVRVEIVTTAGRRALVALAAGSSPHA